MSLTGQMGDGSALRARVGDWRPCRTARAVSTGIPGASLLCEVTAVAPRRG